MKFLIGAVLVLSSCAAGQSDVVSTGDDAESVAVEFVTPDHLSVDANDVVICSLTEFAEPEPGDVLSFDYWYGREIDAGRLQPMNVEEYEAARVQYLVDIGLSLETQEVMREAELEDARQMSGADN